MSLQELPEEVLRIIATYLMRNSRDVINFSHCFQGAFWACQNLPGDNFINIFQAAFPHKIVMLSFYVLIDCVCIF